MRNFKGNSVRQTRNLSFLALMYTNPASQFGGLWVHISCQIVLGKNSPLDEEDLSKSMLIASND
jgi:hypothetical protein